VSRSSLKTVQLALQSQAVLDIPRHTRHVLAVGALVGIGLLIMGTLASPERQSLETDTILHLGGFLMLGALLVMSLPPLLFVPGLLGLAGLGVALEYVQTIVGRSFEWKDVLANSTGIAIGAGLGLLVRGTHAYIRSELAAAEVRKRLITLRPGEILFREGEQTRCFYLVKEGMVELTRELEGQPRSVSLFGPGDVAGAMGVILGTAQVGTAVALTASRVYRMDLEELVSAAKGREQPVATVLTAFAEKLRELAVKLEQAEAELRKRG